MNIRIFFPFFKRAYFRTLFIFLLIFFVGCSNSNNREKMDVELFLENVMIRERGLYVLMGTKPMSTFNLDSGFPESEEERKSYYHRRLNEWKEENSLEPCESYEEFSKNCEKQPHSHHQRLWKAWQEQMGSYVSPRYLFVTRKAPFGDRREDGLFINVPSTIYVLKSNYASFSKITGMGFDPDTILKELSHDESLFWERAFQSHYLGGLLYGYGEKNAVCFEWEIKNECAVPLMRIADHPTIDQTVDIFSKKNVTLADLKLPLFGVYSLDDPTIKKYKREKEYILKELKGKDFYQTVVKWLSEKEPPSTRFIN